MYLGAITDDFTGASDIANTLAKGGRATTQYVDLPQVPASRECDADVVSVKTGRLTPGARLTHPSTPSEAEGAGLPPVRLQIPFDVRFNTARRHRPGRGGACGGAARARCPSLPGVSRHRA